MQAMKTMKKFLSMAALVLVGAVMMSCSSEDELQAPTPQQPVNEDNVVTLTTTVGLSEGSTDGASRRALAADGTKTFAEGDQIAVIYTNTSDQTVKVLSEALPAGDYGKNATFTVTLTNPKASGAVRYIYPAAMAATTVETSSEVNADANVKYSALATQNGTLATLASTLDLAIFDGSLTAGAALPASATMENQLAILACTLKNEAGSSEITGSVTRLMVNDGTYTYYVDRSAAAGPIYVAIRPTADATINITAKISTGYHVKTLTGKTYARNNGYNVSWRMTELPEGALPGKFTINAGGSQVRFSKGNLQAVFASAGSSRTWQFATNQWDYIGSDAANTSINGSGSVSVAGTVDLFGWVGTSSYNNNYGIWNNTTANSYGNTKNESLKNDWGHNAITNGGNTADMWRTLTREEWGYMLSTRSGATVKGSNNVRFAKATIRTDATGVKGLLLFPDGATFDASEASWGVLDDGYENYTTTCTAAQWTALEAKGCVFLPAAGNRTGTTVSDAGSAGAYWTATGSDSKASDTYPYSYRVYFGQTSWGNPQYYSQQQKTYGHSVRLVRAVE